MKQRYLREGDELRDDDIVEVRGGELDPDLLRTDALRNHSVYGTYGISVFAVRDATIDELAQQPPLVRFEYLASFPSALSTRRDSVSNRPAVIRAISTSASTTSPTA